MGGKILVTLGFFPSCLFDLFASYGESYNISLEHKGIN